MCPYKKLILHHLFPLLQDVSHTRPLSPLTNSGTFHTGSGGSNEFPSLCTPVTHNPPCNPAQATSSLPSTSEMYVFQMSRSKFPKRTLFLLMKNSTKAAARYRLLWGPRFGCRPTWVNGSTGHLVAKNQVSWEAGILGPRSKCSDFFSYQLCFLSFHSFFKGFQIPDHR